MASDPIAGVRTHALYHDVHSGKYLFEFHFPTVGGGEGRLVVERGIGVPQLRTKLMDAGWRFPTPKGAAIAELDAAIAQADVPTTPVTTRTGFHGDAFVLRHRTCGPNRSGLIFVKVGTGNMPLLAVEKAGTLEAWRKDLRLPCVRSSYLTFAVSLAMAGALLEPVAAAGGEGASEGVIFELTGKSSSGKTVALRVAQSAMGQCADTNLLSHDLTDRALEEHLAAANGGLLCIDELTRISGPPRQIRSHIERLPHILASGRGRQRSEKAASGGLENLEYRVIGLSSGEHLLESFGERAEGERVRFPDIPVPPPRRRRDFRSPEAGPNLRHLCRAS